MVHRAAAGADVFSLFGSVQVDRILDQVQLSLGPFQIRSHFLKMNLCSSGRFSREVLYAEPDENVENKSVQVMHALWSQQSYIYSQCVSLKQKLVTFLKMSFSHIC